MVDNNSALPGLPPTEDEVLEFESSAVTEGQDSDSEPDDEFLGHIASDVEEDGKLSTPSARNESTLTRISRRNGLGECFVPRRAR